MHKQCFPFPPTKTLPVLHSLIMLWTLKIVTFILLSLHEWEQEFDHYLQCLVIAKLESQRKKKKKIENQSPYMFRFSYLNVGAKGRRFIRPGLTDGFMVSGQGFDTLIIHQPSAIVRSLDIAWAQLQISAGAALHAAEEWNEMDALAAEKTVLELKTPSCLPHLFIA